MAYFDTTSAAGVLNREITATRNILNRISGSFSRALYAMAENSSLNQRVRKVEALKALSDEQLAAKGMRREDIVRNVFADLYYL